MKRNRRSTGKRPMQLNDLIQAKRNDIVQIAARHGATNVRVFGSVARGEATAESDIDVWLILSRVEVSWIWAVC